MIWYLVMMMFLFAFGFLGELVDLQNGTGSVWQAVGLAALTGWTIVLLFSFEACP